MLRWIPFSLIVLVDLVGCSGASSKYDATVEGTVTVADQLVSRGQVIFHPVEDGPLAYGAIFDNGTYSLRIGQGDLGDVDGGAVPSGEYIVTVVINMPSVADEANHGGGPPKPGARVTAAKYATKAESDLRVTVEPGRNVVPLELEPAKVEATEQSDAKTDSGTEAAEVVSDITGEAQSAIEETAESPEIPSEEPASPLEAPKEGATP